MILDAIGYEEDPFKMFTGGLPNDIHTDSYWYVRRGEAKIDGFGKIDIDLISININHNIMPVINVVVKKIFDEVIQGKGYIANLISITRADGNINF